MLLKSWIALITLAVVLPAAVPARANPPTAAAQPDTQADVTAIRTVMSGFDAALQAKDLKAMAGLFYDGKIRWMASGTPGSRALTAKLTGQPVAEIEDQGAYKLLEDPRIQKYRIREQFGEPTISTDGQIASVTFNYDFRVNEVVQNRGLEIWQMVKTAGGWKIFNLLFSYSYAQPAAEGQN